MKMIGNDKYIYIKNAMLGSMKEVQQIELLSDSQTLCKLNNNFIIVNNSDIIYEDKLVIAKKLLNSEKLYKKYQEKYEKLYYSINKLKDELFK